MTESSVGSVKNGLNICQFSIMIFIITCAGPYGIEQIVKAAGPFLTLVGLITVPFVYSLPQTLMCAELSSMMPSNHGYIVWVYRAFGERIGFINACSCVVGTGLDICVYPVLLWAYVSPVLAVKDGSNGVIGYFFKLFIVVSGGILNIFNITLVGNVAILMTICILAPFLIGFVIAIPDISMDVWLRGPPVDDHEYDWSLYLTTILWLHTGWDVMGCMAGEAGFTRSKFFLGFLIAIVLDWVAYTIPLIGALTVPYTNDDWGDGYLLDAYKAILPGLQYFVMAGGVLSLFALYMVEMSAHVRSLWAISQPFIVFKPNGDILMEDRNYDISMHIADTKSITEEQTRNKMNSRIRGVNNETLKENLDSVTVIGIDSEQSNTELPIDELSHLSDELRLRDDTNITASIAGQSFARTLRVGILPRCFGYVWPRTDVPINAVFLQCGVCAVAISLDFATLVEISMFVFGVTWLMEFSSFLYLRYSEPYAIRPFTVPGGMPVAWVVTLIKFVIIAAVFIGVAISKPLIFFITVGFELCIVIWLGIREYCNWRQTKFQT